MKIAQPSRVIALRGGSDLTHRPENKSEPRPPEKMPPCPPFLDAKAKEEWKRAAEVLFPIGLLTEADMMVFAVYCEAFSRWSMAVKEVAKNGAIVKTPVFNKAGKQTGSIPRRNPYLAIMDDAYTHMIKAGMLLGLSPSSRANLKVGKGKPKSKVESFMGRKNAQKAS
jgi:P27 family predicted phage terminase small subunit